MRKFTDKTFAAFAVVLTAAWASMPLWLENLSGLDYAVIIGAALVSAWCASGLWKDAGY